MKPLLTTIAAALLGVAGAAQQPEDKAQLPKDDYFTGPGGSFNLHAQQKH